jgi:serine/threonine protein kinase
MQRKSEDYPMFLGDRFQLREPIGRGGMSTIYRGWDSKTEREVAIKVLREVYSTDPKFVSFKKSKMPIAIDQFISGHAQQPSQLTLSRKVVKYFVIESCKKDPPPTGLQHPACSIFVDKYT